MRQQQIHTGIGIFVFGAFILTCVSVFTFFNQYVKGKVETYVMFFNGSLNGLDASSSVMYRGVKVGGVRRIELIADKTSETVMIPVYVEFFVGKSFAKHGNPIKILINKGIVATISSSNLLTGTASIELVQGIKKHGPLKLSEFHGHTRFPTESFMDKNTAAADTMQALRKTLTDISGFLASKEMSDTMLAIRDAAISIKTATKSVREAASSVEEGALSLKSGAKSVDTFALLMDQQVPGVIRTFNDTLKEISKTAYSTRNLTDFLARHPESLLRGK